MGKPPKKIISIKFYRATNNIEPVRAWLKKLTKTQKRIIGVDLKTVEMGWPLGMPLIKSLGGKLKEVRSNVPNGTARIFFVVKNHHMILLHAFMKKTQHTPERELVIARKRAKEVGG